jgi:primosomal protein N' (replication factor Y)
MIAKGLDFPLVTLSAVIGADTSLHIPDYRSTESLFQVMTQVVGRSGRGELQGTALIQTYYPDHPVMKSVQKADFQGFIKEELSDRKLCNYPPYTKIIKLIFTSKDKQGCEKSSNEVYCFLKSAPIKETWIYKPTPCGHPKINENFRFQILIKTKQVNSVTKILKRIPVKMPLKVRLLIDVGSTSTFS